MRFTDEEKEQIAEENIKLINYVLSKHNLKYKRDELFDVGLIGLTNGINTYDKSKEVKISTYLYKCILFQIFRSMEYDKALKRRAEIISYNTEITDSGKELEELLGYDPEYDKEIVNQEMIEKIYKRITSLPEKKQKMFYYYFGVNGYPKLTQKEIADLLKLKNNGNVQKQLQKIIRMLKYELRDYK